MKSDYNVGSSIVAIPLAGGVLVIYLVRSSSLLDRNLNTLLEVTCDQLRHYLCKVPSKKCHSVVRTSGATSDTSMIGEIPALLLA
jgi:hypothetical protein